MKTREMVAAAMFAALTAILAQISVPLPFSPVPITFQVLAVCLAAAILGSRLGALSQLIYVVMGAIGMPVFAGGTSGLQRLAGPTGGYILSYIIAAFIIGIIVEKFRPALINTFLAMLAGLVIIYAMGMTQLSIVTGMDLKAAFMAGVAPFIGMDIIKIAAGSYVAYSVRTVLLKQKLLSAK
jgi:biotin transport system substrate-specific component